jgi:hypothetical protein
VQVAVWLGCCDCAQHDAHEVAFLATGAASCAQHDANVAFSVSGYNPVWTTSATRYRPPATMCRAGSCAQSQGPHAA